MIYPTKKVEYIIPLLQFLYLRPNTQGIGGIVVLTNNTYHFQSNLIMVTKHDLNN